MFPDQGYAASLNCIKVYVHRVREKIAPDFIVCERNGYRFRTDVRVDLAEYEGIVHLLERRPFLAESDRDILHAVLGGLCGRRNAPVSRWDWFESTEAKIGNIAARAAAGNPSEAICEFRQYEAQLARDLQTTPSPHLRKLLHIA